MPEIHVGSQSQLRNYTGSIGGDTKDLQKEMKSVRG